VRAYELKTSNIQVTAKLSPDLPWTLVDEGQIQQVLLNIITNAEQAMRRHNGKGQLSVTSRNQDSRIQVSIADNGKGIAAENLEKIFEPFFTTKEPGEGTGLGLSISYSIIREHSGRLYARSNPGRGTTFTIELPITAEPRQHKLAESSPAEPGGANGGKILVVDDEPDICHLIYRLLGREGYKVETTLNARQALEKLSTKRYQLILVDIKMPDISGIEFYRRVGRIARSIQKRIVFITGDTISTETGAFLQKTGATYINKPFGIKEFNQTVNKMLAER
jgi:CheY-like chemotaxis protein/anti-sigma regulatory factor (Ser/Thr protein kinase)